MTDKPLRILVTGARRGIGQAIAAELSDRHTVFGLSRSAPAQPSTITMVQADVTSADSIAHAFAQIGPVDVLVNNAGIATFGDFQTMSIDAMEDQIQTNLLGSMRLLKMWLPPMLEASRGMIITINSVAATTTFSGCGAYAASKAGLLALTRSLRQDVRSYGVKVVDLIVGATETEIWDESMRTEYAHRMMRPEDIATAVSIAVSSFAESRSMIEEMTIRPQFGDL